KRAGWTDEAIAARGPSVTQRAIEALEPLRGRRVEVPKPEGRLYEVSLPDGPYLDFDAPIAEQDPEAMALAERLYDLPAAEIKKRRLQFRLVGPRDSELAREAGFVGIRYLDQGSRAKGEGSHNYVIFSDADVEI